MKSNKKNLFSKFIKFVANFWYYHKWMFLFGVVLFIFLLISTVQLFTATKPDATFLYSSSEKISTENLGYMCQALEGIVSDLNLDGKKTVDLKTVFVHPQNAALDRLEQNEVNQDYQDFDTEITVGDSIIFLLDEKQYERAKKSNPFIKLSEIADSLPNEINDEFSIRLGDCALSKLPGFRALSQNLIVCFRSPEGVISESENSALTKEDYFSLYRKIIFD